ncbi:TRAP transporter substrate-binding protein [Desulfitibacter alkalitolerans]|uniref:TRAP transporter substrate-binding protein n=1 Tax=Desulfitibacter alkalitolerans TaxID=264641 RepID=UPI0006841CEB|nr:TRAP transporter substrate-binding protein [Desulfitibacter alkalitolerans]
MKKAFAIVLMVMLIGSLVVGCGGGSKAPEAPQGSNGDAAQQPIEMVLAHTGGPGSAVELTYDKFKELVEEKTNGQITIEIFGAGTLAGDQTAVEGAQIGTIDIGSAGTNNMAPFTDQFLFGDLPYIMTSIENGQKVWGGEIGKELMESVGQELGIKGLFFVDVGDYRVLGNNRKPVKVPEDLRGLKIRATASPIEQAILRAWGASPTPVPWPEVYMALEQKVVEGTYVQHMWTTSAKQHEAMHYYSEVGGVQNMHFCFMSLHTWNKLTTDQQQAVLEAAEEAQAYNFEIAPKLVDELRVEMERVGGEFYYPTDEEMEKWMSIKDAVWNEFADKVDQDLVRRVVEFQK